MTAYWLMIALIAALLVVAPVGDASADDPIVVRATPETLPTLIETVAPGTTIELAPGMYTSQRIWSKDDITLRAEEPGTAIFTHDAFDDGKGLDIVDSTSITIDGVVVSHAKTGIVILRSSGVFLTNVKVHDVGQRGIWIHGASDNVTILHSSVRRTGLRPGVRRDDIAFSSISEGIFVGDSNNPDDGTNTVIIAGNVIAETGAEAVDVKAGVTGIDVSSNIVFDVTTQVGAISLHPGEQPTNPGWARATNNIVSNVRGVDGSGGNGLVISTSAVVDSNVVFDIEKHGILLSEIYGDSRFVAMRNNTVFDTGGEEFSVADHDPELPSVHRWGNRGKSRLENFPTGWIHDQMPTAQMWEFLERQRAEVQAAQVGEPVQPNVEAPITEEPEPSPVDAIEFPEPPIVELPEPPIFVPAEPAEPQVPAPIVEPTLRPPAADGQFPVYDTAWQMLVRATPQQTDNYFSTLSDYGFTGSWAAIIHHAPATYLHRHAGGGQVGRYENGQIILDAAYIAHVRSILDTAQRHGQKVGLIAAWQNTYLPGGNSGADTLSNRVEGTLTTQNAYAYGRQIADAFGDHPAVSMWVFGGDAGTNNTEANKAVWRVMASALDDAGMTQPIGYHTPTAHFGQLNYAGEPWLDFVAPETGHNQGSDKTETELRAAVNAFDVPVWQGESRYFGINFSSWIKPQYQNPGRNEVVADAQAARRAGVGGYVYGDAGRWAWCLFQNGNGDASPCNPNNIGASFGQAERDVINALRN